MSAIDWIRSKATILMVDEFEITEEEAAADETIEAGNWRATIWAFKGKLPVHMKRELNKITLEVRTNEVTEVLRFPNKYVNNHTYCEYSRTVYEKVGG